ncbi:family 16 glycosylhydrolase [Cellulosimicrobium cellulans]|uniref:family 16 glycosylhydrolase n=1 Tax=Cellulosimicrobium cellulans TaxID=1710 RepID=UPI000848B5CA|nr:family 16 glycosylhydrolase [Cellulosimicrobium cellulans]
MRTRPLVVALVVTVALTGAAVVIHGADGPSRGPLTWSDEFDGPAGTPPDPSRWRYDLGGDGWGNGELQRYTDSTRNAAHDGEGHLVITARRENHDGATCHYGSCEFTSARLLTAGLFEQRYGTFEARIKVPRGQGMWPAFWMLGRDVHTTDPWPTSGEIDVMENVGKEPGTVWGSLHMPGRSGANSVTASSVLPEGSAFADDFHVYTVDWRPGSVTWSVDGETYAHVTPDDVDDGRWVFDDDPFFLILNLAVGGVWPGPPDGSTQLPQQMLVDWVRVYAGTDEPPDDDSTGTPAGTGEGEDRAEDRAGDDGSGAPEDGATPAARPIRGLAGRCIGVPGDAAVAGTPIVLETCDDGPGQQWTFAPDGTVRALGLCMEVAGGSTADGAAVQLATCSGARAQQLVLTPAADLVSVPADRCVDVRDASTADGAPLQTWTCAGTENQKWWLG